MRFKRTRMFFFYLFFFFVVVVKFKYMEYSVDDKIVIRLLSSLTLYFTPSPPSIQLPKQSPNSNFILINWTCNTFQLVPTENLNHSRLQVQPQVKIFKEKPALLCLKIRLILFDLKKNNKSVLLQIGHEIHYNHFSSLVQNTCMCLGRSQKIQPFYPCVTTYHVHYFYFLYNYMFSCFTIHLNK